VRSQLIDKSTAELLGRAALQERVSARASKRAERKATFQKIDKVGGESICL